MVFSNALTLDIETDMHEMGVQEREKHTYN